MKTCPFWAQRPLRSREYVLLSAETLRDRFKGTSVIQDGRGRVLRVPCPSHILYCRVEKELSAIFKLLKIYSFFLSGTTNCVRVKVLRHGLLFQTCSEHPKVPLGVCIVKQVNYLGATVRTT